MNKKAFTLVELLAVIAILALLAIIAIPNVLRILNESRLNSFANEVKTIGSYSTKQWLSENISDAQDVKEYIKIRGEECSNCNTLHIDGGEKLSYSIIVKNGKLTKIHVDNGVYSYKDESDGGIDLAEINTSEIEKYSESNKVTLQENNTTKTYVIEYVLNTNLGQGPSNQSIYPNQTYTVNYDEEVEIIHHDGDKSSYCVCKWNTKQNGSGTTYNEGQKVKNLTNADKISLYAVWEECPTNQIPGLEEM